MPFQALNLRQIACVTLARSFHSRAYLGIPSVEKDFQKDVNGIASIHETITPALIILFI